MSAHPRPRCLFGRPHTLTRFVFQEDRYVCITCGVEDRDEWWEGPNLSVYVGPAEPVVLTVTPGLLLEEAAAFGAGAVREGT